MEKPDWILMLEKMHEIRRFSRTLIRRATKEYEIPAECLDFLSQLAVSEEKMTPLMLSEKMGVSKTIISRITEYLNKNQLIIKERDEKDKRSYFILITELGKKQVEIMYKHHLGPLYELRRSLGEERFNDLINTIEKANLSMSEPKEEE